MWIYYYIVTEKAQNVKRRSLVLMYYLQKVEIILKGNEYRSKFLSIVQKLIAEGMKVGYEQTRSTHTLLITDSSFYAGKAVTEGRAVLAFLHEGNYEQNFNGVRYAFEEPEELDVDYLEQVYRRYAGLPWDILDTRRCHLRETTEEDVDDFYRIYAEPSITQYMEDLYREVEQEKEYTRKYIQNVYGFYGFGVWTVIKRDTGEVIGRAGLSYREGFEEPELGFVIGVPWQRQGYALEVCKAVLRYGREQFGFEKVQAMVEPENEASLHLCSKLGMIAEGTEVLQKKRYIRLVKKWS